MRTCIAHPTWRIAGSHLAVLLTATLLAACDSNDPEEPSLAGLPLFFSLQGTAVATNPSGLVVECSLDLLFELEEEARREGAVEYRGTHGGDAARAVAYPPPETTGVAFSAFVGGEVLARLVAPDSVALRIPINETAENRFFRELARLEGTIGEDSVGTGSWTCAPLDLNQEGYVDTTLTATGTWHLTPLPTGTE